MLASLWVAVGELHRAGIAHRGLTLEALSIDDDGDVWLDDFDQAETAPPEQETARDVAVLLTETALVIGPDDAVTVDVRVLAATHRDLKAMAAEGRFREDLLFRLNVVNLHLPPLRERRDDIPLLVNYFLEKIAREQGRKPKSIASAAIKLLEKYHWPGNVRELENAIRRARVLAKSDAILPGDLPPEISGAAAGAAAPPPTATSSTGSQTSSTRHGLKPRDPARSLDSQEYPSAELLFDFASAQTRPAVQEGDSDHISRNGT